MEKQEDILKELVVLEGMMEAEILKSKLESFEIPCVLKFETAGRLLGISMNGLGKVKLMVAPQDFERASQLIEVDEEDEVNEELGE